MKLANEHGAEIAFDWVGHLDAEQAKGMAQALRTALVTAIPDEDNPIVTEKTPGRATVIGPAIDASPAAWFGGARRGQVEAVIAVLETGTVHFG